jgi:hypothetical protein
VVMCTLLLPADVLLVRPQSQHPQALKMEVVSAGNASTFFVNIMCKKVFVHVAKTSVVNVLLRLQYAGTYTVMFACVLLLRLVCKEREVHVTK